MDEFFRIGPSEAGVRNGFSVDMILNLAVAFLYIAFNHNAFNDIVQVFVLCPVVEYFGDNPGLLIEFFA